jgi:hypothetical protein
MSWWLIVWTTDAYKKILFGNFSLKGRDNEGDITEKLSEISDTTLNIVNKFPKEHKKVLSPDKKTHIPLFKNKSAKMDEEGMERSSPLLSPIRKRIVFSPKKQSQMPLFVEPNRKSNAKQQRVRQKLLFITLSRL